MLEGGGDEQTGAIVSLDGHEDIELVFHFMSYDLDVSQDSNPYTVGDKGITSKNSGNQVKCGFTINEMGGNRGGQVIGGMGLDIEVTGPQIDRTLRYFELECRATELAIPKLFGDGERIQDSKFK